MHYKNLAFAALAGIVLLSSCVKDLETKSVTDIRNAKLEEIKSQTALNNAKAASEKTLSEAEALLKAAQADAQKAQAEYLKAQAAYQQALTDGLLIENQQKAAELEAALIQAEISKAKAQAELDRLAMDLERQLLDAQRQLLTAMSNFEAAEKTRLTTLANAYTSATITLLAAQNELVQLKADLTSAEEKLVDLQTIKEKQVVKNNAKIAALEKVLAAYQESLGMTEEEVQAKVSELYAALQEANNEAALAYDAYDESSAELWVARADIYNYLIWGTGNYYLGIYTDYYSFYASLPPTYGNGINKYSYSYSDVDGNQVKVPVVALPSSQYDEKTDFSTVVDGKDVPFSYWSLRTYNKAEILDPDAPATVAAAAKEVIAKKHENNVASTQTEINKYEAMIAAAEKAVSEYDAETKALYEEKAELEEKSEEAFAAYQEANKPYTEYLAKHYTEQYSAWTAYDDAQQTKFNLENEVNNLQSDISWLSNEDWGPIKWVEENVASCTKNVSEYSKEVETKTTAVEDAQEAYDDQLNVVEPLLAKKNEAYAAYREKYLAYLAGTLEDYTKVTEAETAYSTARDAWATEDATLQSLKSDLTAAQGYLESAKSNLNYAKQDLTRAEISLENYKSQLAKAESDLAKKEPELEAAKVAEKTARDAYLAAQNAIDSSADKEYAALEKANTEALNKYNDADNSVRKVTEKISSIEITNKSVAYTYEDLVKKTTITEVIIWYTYFDGYSDVKVYPYYHIYKSLLEEYNNTLEIRKNKLAEYNTSFDEFNKQVDEWLAKLTSIVESESAYASDIESLNQFELATFNLYKEYTDLDEKSDDIYSQYSALTSDETKIENYKTQIENLKKSNADITDITSQEQAVARIKTDIANKEAEIEVYKKVADNAKAALDAALAEEE